MPGVKEFITVSLFAGMHQQWSSLYSISISRFMQTFWGSEASKRPCSMLAACMSLIKIFSNHSHLQEWSRPATKSDLL